MIDNPARLAIHGAMNSRVPPSDRMLPQVARRRRQSKPEERQRCLLQDHLRHLKRCHHRQHRHDLRQDVLAHDVGGAATIQGRGLDERTLPQRPRQPEHHAGVNHPAGNPQYQDQVQGVTAERGDHQDGQQDVGECHLCVGKAHDCLLVIPPRSPAIMPATLPIRAENAIALTPTRIDSREP